MGERREVARAAERAVLADDRGDAGVEHRRRRSARSTGRTPVWPVASVCSRSSIIARTTSRSTSAPVPAACERIRRALQLGARARWGCGVVASAPKPVEIAVGGDARQRPARRPALAAAATAVSASSVEHDLGVRRGRRRRRRPRVSGGGPTRTGFGMPSSKPLHGSVSAVPSGLVSGIPDIVSCGGGGGADDRREGAGGDPGGRRPARAREPPDPAGGRDGRERARPGTLDRLPAAGRARGRGPGRPPARGAGVRAGGRRLRTRLGVPAQRSARAALPTPARGRGGQDAGNGSPRGAARGRDALPAQGAAAPPGDPRHGRRGTAAGPADRDRTVDARAPAGRAGARSLPLDGELRGPHRRGSRLARRPARRPRRRASEGLGRGGRARHRRAGVGGGCRLRPPRPAGRGHRGHLPEPAGTRRGNGPRWRPSVRRAADRLTRRLSGHAPS